jgi:hypothetical protein
MLIPLRKKLWVPHELPDTPCNAAYPTQGDLIDVWQPHGWSASSARVDGSKGAEVGRLRSQEA